MEQYVTQLWLKEQLPPSLQLFADRWRDSSHRDQSTYLALFIAGQHLGHLQGPRATEVMNAFAEASIPFNKEPSKLELTCPVEEIQSHLNKLGLILRDKGLVPGWRNELHTLYDQNGLPLCDIERALFKVMGLCSQAVHVHAETENGLIWLGVRSHTKHENPGMLDNLTAGGIGAQEPVIESLTRELNEEAGFDSLDALADRPCLPRFMDLNAILRGDSSLERFPQCTVQVSRPLENGWHHELIVLCHLRLKNEWLPCNQDGEVAGFELMTRSDCTKAVNRWMLTPDAALATAIALAQ